jgi:ATP synthase subunit G
MEYTVNEKGHAVVSGIGRRIAPFVDIAGRKPTAVHATKIFVSPNPIIRKNLRVQCALVSFDHESASTSTLHLSIYPYYFLCKDTRHFLLFAVYSHAHVYLHFFPAGRGDRMKQAKVEAQVLIDAYRGEKQEEFNNMALSKGGSEGSASAKLHSDTNKDIQEMQSLFQKNAQQAVDLLLSKCCEVSLEVPAARVRATQKIAGVDHML